MWSGPRNLSTAMMRSFGSRADCAVWDEPFFAPFLNATGTDHPGRAETLAAHETDPDIVAQQCSQDPADSSELFFQKHMPHHMIHSFPQGWMVGGAHFFLIRDPARVIASYAKGRAKFTLDDLGFAPQRDLFDRLLELNGSPPPVIDSLDILKTPELTLRALCHAINVSFDPAMLSWEAGPRPEDGAWAPYWYKSVENSTGFGPPPSGKPEIPEQYRDMLAACQADFDYLNERRIRV